MRTITLPLCLVSLASLLAGCGDSGSDLVETVPAVDNTGMMNTGGTGVTDPVVTPDPVVEMGGAGGAAPVEEPVFVPTRPTGIVPNGEWPDSMVNLAPPNVNLCDAFRGDGDELYKSGLVSPTMGDVHHNQPSVINGYLLLAGNAEHYFWDISDPTAPVQLSTFTSPDNSGEAESHQISFGRIGDQMYAVTTSGKGVDIWNITDIMAPTLETSVPIEGINYGDVAGGVWGMSWQGDTIYIGANDTGLHILNASDPANTTLVKTLPVGDVGGEFPGPLWAIGNILVIVSPKGHGNVATMDISDPMNPILLDAFHPKDSYIGAFYGKHAYLQSPLRVWDVLTDPTTIGSADAPMDEMSTAGSEYMSFHDGYMFLGHLRPNPGASKINVADPTSMELVSRIWGRCDLDMNDDQFTLAVGPLLVMADDEKKSMGNVGSVIGVHDTKPDTTPLQVEHIIPVDGAVGQALTTRVGISFNDHIEFATVTPDAFFLRPVGGEPVPAKFGMTTTTLSLDPDTDLLPGTTYEVVLRKDGITDLVGNAIAEEVVSTFSTQ